MFMPDDPGVNPPDYPAKNNDGLAVLLLRFLLLFIIADVVITVFAQYYI